MNERRLYGKHKDTESIKRRLSLRLCLRACEPEHIPHAYIHINECTLYYVQKIASQALKLLYILHTDTSCDDDKMRAHGRRPLSERKLSNERTQNGVGFPSPYACTMAQLNGGYYGALMCVFVVGERALCGGLCRRMSYMLVVWVVFFPLVSFRSVHSFFLSSSIWALSTYINAREAHTSQRIGRYKDKRAHASAQDRMVEITYTQTHTHKKTQKCKSSCVSEHTHKHQTSQKGKVIYIFVACDSSEFERV